MAVPAELLAHLTVILLAAFLGTVTLDAMMTYLQGKHHRWRVSLSDKEAFVQMSLLFVFSLAGYYFGYNVGEALPYSKPMELFFVGASFAFMASLLPRGEMMLHIYKRKDV